MEDERTRIEFETEYNLTEAFPWRIDASEALLKCSQSGLVCPATSLVVVKHRMDSQPIGHLRLYCPEHAATWRAWRSGAANRIGAICPNCFTSVPLGTGVRDTCGWCANAS